MKNIYDEIDSYLVEDKSVCVDSAVDMLWALNCKVLNLNEDKSDIDFVASLNSLKDAYDSIPVRLTDEFEVFYFLNYTASCEVLCLKKSFDLLYVVYLLYVSNFNFSSLNKTPKYIGENLSFYHKIYWYLLFLSIYDLVKKVRASDESEINRIQRKIDSYCRNMKELGLLKFLHHKC